MPGNTRVGISYRSRIEQNLKGDAEFSNVPAGLAPVPVFKITGVKADITLPDSLSVSFFHAITPQWMVMADFTWTNWSLFKQLFITFDNPNQPPSTTTENWQDNYRYSLGLTYAPNDAWTLRTGVAYDTSAVAEAKYAPPASLTVTEPGWHLVSATGSQTCSALTPAMRTCL